MNKYSVNILWSDEDKGFIALSPEFPGLSAFGKTRQDAIEEAQAALQLFIDSYRDDGLELPEPNGVQTYSGQYRVRLPKSLHRQAAQMAISDGVSLNQFTLDAIAEKVGGKRAYDQVTQAKRTQKEVRRKVRRNLSDTPSGR